MGTIFKVPAVIIYVVAGLWGFFVSLGIVTDELGFIGGAIAFVFFPVALAFAPWVCGPRTRELVSTSSRLWRRGRSVGLLCCWRSHR